MKKIAFVVIAAAALLYFLVNAKTKKLKDNARGIEDALTSQIPLNAFEGPDIGL